MPKVAAVISCILLSIFSFSACGGGNMVSPTFTPEQAMTPSAETLSEQQHSGNLTLSVPINDFQSFILDVGQGKSLKLSYKVTPFTFGGSKTDGMEAVIVGPGGDIVLEVPPNADNTIEYTSLTSGPHEVVFVNANPLFGQNVELTYEITEK